MVLARVLPLVLVAACGESLFDNNIAGGGGGGGDGGADSNTMPLECPGSCLASAAADFDGTAGGGAGDKWAYFDDLRNRTWMAMTPNDGGLTGADAGTFIKTCGANPTAAACGALPGALLVSTGGASATADPAIAYVSDATRVISLKVLVHVPAGPSQLVRLYRNSREDVLFTAVATAGTTLDQTLVVDALTSDRFFVALAPTGDGASDVGVHFFVSDTGALFPMSCQNAVSFSSATGNNVDDACDAVDPLFSHYDDGAMAPVLVDGPFPEQGHAADIAPDMYYELPGTLIKTGGLTIQFWMKFDGLVPSYDAYPFSDIDLDNGGGGLAIAIYETTGLQIQIHSQPDSGFIQASAPYPSDNAWHFIRVTHANGIASLCLDGSHVAQLTVAADVLQSARAPFLGANQVWSPQGGYFDGQLDDFRVFSGALPCAAN